MAKENVAKFFAQVYENKALQGALHGALAVASPETVVEIAKNKGFNFTADELKDVVKPRGGELSDKEMEAVAGGALNYSSLASYSLQTNFWSSVSPTALKIGGIQAFGLGIPGPSFVHVMSDEPTEEPPPEADQETVSATDIFNSLV